MDYIDKIEIKITNLSQNMELIVIPSTLQVYTKNNTKTITKEWLDDLLNIICKWDYKYIDNSIIDAETYTIKVYTEGTVDEYFGKGKYPRNYIDFINLVRDVYGENN